MSEKIEVLEGDSVGDFFFWFAPGSKTGPISVSRDEFIALIEKAIVEENDEHNVRTRN